MDWTDQPELLAIFQEEIEDRARRLVEGSRSMLNRQLIASEVAELARHAHTVKGSARIMGLPVVSAAAATLERAWKGVGEGTLAPSLELGASLEAVASRLVDGAARERAGDTFELVAVTSGVEAFLARGGLLPNPNHPSMMSRVPTAPPPPPPPPSAAPETKAARTPASSPGTGREDPVSLGGLLSSIEGIMLGTATRVDSAHLYRLINRAVELNLDIDALAQVVGEGRPLPVRRLSQAAAEVQQLAVTLAQAPLREATETFPQFVRYLARRADKEVRFELVGDDVEADRQVVDLLREPLRHLLVNAVDHGIESPAERTALGKSPTGTVSLHGQIVDHRLVVTVADDGRGINWAKVAGVAAAHGLSTSDADLSGHLFAAGFSTVGERNDFSGDGAGLAAVAETAERLNGGVRLESRLGEGTTAVLTLPASLALQNVFLVRACGNQWGIPEAAVLASFPVGSAEVKAGTDRMELWFQGEAIPIASLASVLGVVAPEAADEVVVLATRSGPVAITVPEALGRRRVAVKSLGPILGGSPHLAAAAVLGGGEVVVVIEPNHLGDRARRLPAVTAGRPRVLVVDDSKGVRQLVAATLSGKGFEVEVASDAAEATRLLAVQSIDALVVDFSMPGSDGVALVEGLRSARHRLPIVMVSSVASPEDQARAWRAGVDAYLDKFDLRKGALAATLRSLLEMRSDGGAR